jgi:HEAT repeat protein
MTAAPPKVFISYSHDSDEHAARVLKLANELRRDGVDAIIDQYLTSPPQGWPAWMDAHIRDDDFIIMVCTETYYRRVMRKEEPAVGHGVAWEGSLIYNHIYRDKCDLLRFVPVLLNGGSHDHIPDPLAGATYYLVETPRGYEGLLRQIFEQPEAQMPPIGKPPALPQRTAQWMTRPPPAVALTPEPVPPAGGVVAANGAVDAPIGVSAATLASEEITWKIVIKANNEDIVPLITRVTNILQELSGDATLSIKRISPGSVVLELECSNKAGLRLYHLIADGKLVEILGYKVQSIVIAPLIAALHDPDESVRKEAAEVLGKLGDTRAVEPLIEALKDDNWEVHWRAAGALEKIGTPAVQPLIEALKGDKASFRWGANLRWAAAEALGKIGIAALQPLIDALKNDKTSLRWRAASALGKIKDTRAVPPLIEALKDDDWEVCRVAMDALGNIGVPAVPPLIEALKDDDAGVRWRAAGALGKIGDAQAVPPLFEALTDHDKNVRRAAAGALGKIKDIRAVPPLTEALKDDDWEVCRVAMDALGNIGVPAVPSLTEALEDDDEGVRGTVD